MEYFWYTSDTIPKGLGFSHFDGLHLAWLAAAVVIITGCCLLYRGMNQKQRSIFRKVIALLLVIDELFKDIPMIVMGIFDVKYLPFQLCSINIFLIVWHAWRPNKTLSAFLYTVCIPGAIAALLFPTWTKLPAVNYMSFHSFTAHILLTLYPVVLTAAGEIKPRLRDVPKCLGLLACLAGVALALNLLWDCNFMFLMSVGKSNPLYIFEKMWGEHLLGFPVLITAIVIVLYGPVEIYHKLKKK